MISRKNIILIYTLVFIFFAAPYIIHLIKLGAVSSSISINENIQEKRFEKIKNKIHKEFNQTFPNDKFIFDDLYKIRKATTYIDTTISFFIYSNTITKKKLDFEYIECLKQKVNSEATKNIAERKFEMALKKLEKEYGNLVYDLVNKISRTKFFNYYSTGLCPKYFEENITYEFNPVTITALKRFLIEYKINQASIEQNNKNIDLIYTEEIKKLKTNLSIEDQKLFDNYLANSFPIVEDFEQFNFTSDKLGNFDYSIPAKIINQEALNNALNKINDEHYKNYSLRNGDMPYSNCYGANNYGASKITINAGNSDVLVTVKNIKNIVVRHAYVKSNRSFSLRIQNGRYHVYFYYGTGWNPKRIMPKTICNNLIGGFVNNENTNKDPEIIDLYYSNLSYTLKIQQNGNFQTENCSKNEAF